MGLGLFRRLDREGSGIGSAHRRTILTQRADAAGGVARGANGGAQVHHRLGKIAGAQVRRDAVGGGADVRPGRGQRCRYGEQTCDHPLDIGVDHHGAAAKGNRGDGRGGIGAQARQGAQCIFGVGEAAAMVGHHGAGAGQQVAGTGIIAQPRPGGHQVGVGAGGQILHRRPADRELLEIGADRRNRGLLQHHFGQPDAIGIGRIGARRRTPGQTPGMDVIMGQQIPCDF